MPDTSGSVLELTELDVDWEKTIPCSGTGHTSGMDRHLHGDPAEPAEWLMRHECPNCHKKMHRPVCTFFKEHGITEGRFVICAKCSHRDASTEFYTVVRKL